MMDDLTHYLPGNPPRNGSSPARPFPSGTITGFGKGACPGNARHLKGLCPLTAGPSALPLGARISYWVPANTGGFRREAALSRLLSRP